MNILPKLLYLFQVIPINPGAKFFSELNKITKKFIWQGKRARIKTNILEDLKERGGLALPNWKLYYKAAALTWVKEWLTLENKRILKLEGHDLMLGWHAFVWYQKYKTHSYFKNHLLRKALVEVWEETKKHHFTVMPEWISPLEAVTHPKLVQENKILKYEELLDENLTLKTKEKLQEEGKTVDWWQYAQLQSRFFRDKKLYTFRKEKNYLGNVLIQNQKKAIGKIYRFLIDFKTIGWILKDNMQSWCKNFRREIDIDTWEKVWTYNWKITKSVSYKENQIKMFYRWHLPPNRISKMFPKVSPLCWKCEKETGTYYHQWWTCPKVNNYWSNVETWIKEITKINIKKTPELFLLGISDTKYKKDVFYLMTHILVAARIILASKWKDKEIPRKEEVVRKIMDCAEMDMMTRRLNNQTDSDFYKVWQKFYIWLDRLKN